MAVVVESELMERLEVLARPLLEEARDIAPRFTIAFQTPEENAVAREVQALVLSFQAGIRSSDLGDLGLMAVLGILFGTVLGQSEGDRRVLYEAFKIQGSQMLAEVSAAREPAGHA